ncbi:E3 ubiquitin-protein ligase KCMF1 [Hydra vulgaris]|uniref:RING-type E3 ubiquitin transferase n=1 Tax=Hydra vulgaris TaxID=6087 RepID=T2M4N4_HYDVU|nr:E3 ubiquitin-protein ligase KCMF1 [Hydra vulgaris]
MSRHEGVSCDFCSKSNFGGKRYKCLICFDYDLCSTCHDNCTTTTRHSSSHPMQCINTRSDFELFYGGEPSVSLDQQPSSYSFVCPHCGKLGFSETLLFEHVSESHANATIEVICPICAALPGGDPNHVTDDLVNHLSIEHRAESRDREMEEPLSRNIRRLFHPTTRSVQPPRSRRGVSQLSANLSSSSSEINALSNENVNYSSARESIDPIAELLTQLSGVRRVAQQQSAAISASHLQLLQQKLQFERQQVQQARERLERLPRKQPTPTSTTAVTITTKKTTKAETNTSSNETSKYLLSQYYSEISSKERNDEDIEEQQMQSDFTKDLVYSLISPEIYDFDISEKSDEIIAPSNSNQNSIFSSVGSSEKNNLFENTIVSGLRVSTESSLNSNSPQELSLKKQCSSVEVFLQGDNKNDSNESVS